MPQVSRWKLTKEDEQNLLDALQLVFIKLTKNEDMNAFLKSLLTDTEKLMLAKRLAIVVLLNENLPEGQIAEALHVTRMTVAKMRYYLDSHGEGYQLALQKLKEQQLMDDFKRLLFRFLSYGAKAAGGRI